MKRGRSYRRKSDRGDEGAKQVAIVGGGPGGLLAAYFLESYCSELCEVTLFEADARLGGKISTNMFSAAPVLYEAGVAELYDYSHFGPDPLKQLVESFGLKPVPMRGSAIQIGDDVIKCDKDIARKFGPASLTAWRRFQEQCRTRYSPEDYYEEYHCRDNAHPWSQRSFRDVLSEIPDSTARRLIEISVRSDTATEPYLTNGLNGLKNVLMDDPRYHGIYSIEGGIERIVDELKKRIDANVRLGISVTGVGSTGKGRYRVTTNKGGKQGVEEFDFVVLALPNYWLACLNWGYDSLGRALQRHLVRYDRPAHYLRIAVLFERPFWRGIVDGSYFMSDAFGGCCVYIEGARHPSLDSQAALSWLLAGNHALTLSNLLDTQLIAHAIASLPSNLRPNRSSCVEGLVHRWAGTVNALPGGYPVESLRTRHHPDPQNNPGIFLVGDYLFDSTLNGVCDSAAYVAESIMAELRAEKYLPRSSAIRTNGSLQSIGPNHNTSLSKGYFKYYDGKKDYEKAIDEYFSAKEVASLIKTVWGATPPYTLLDCGSANGLTLKAFNREGIEAWGVENNYYIHRRTPRKWRMRNLFCDIRKLPFPDDSFDFAYDTCLCYVPERDIDVAIRELFRVCRVGVLFGSIPADVTLDLAEDDDVFYGVQSFRTLWDWSDRFVSNGFKLAVSDPELLNRAWAVMDEFSEGGPIWYSDRESLRYCFYSKPGIPRLTCKGRNGPRLRQRPRPVLRRETLAERR